MKKLVKHITMIMASVLLASVPVATAYARGGGADGTGNGGSSHQSGESKSEMQKQMLEQQQELQKHQTEVKMHQTEMQNEAQEKLKERAKELLGEGEKEKKHDPSERKKTCEERKVGLETKLANLIKNGQKHQDKITEFLDKAVKYQQDNKITDADVAALILKATDAKATSAASVAALKALSPTIDCSSQTVSADIATFKAAAEQARDDLKDYRKSVKAVFEALEKLKDVDTEGSQ